MDKKIDVETLRSALQILKEYRDSFTTVRQPTRPIPRGEIDGVINTLQRLLDEDDKD